MPERLEREEQVSGGSAPPALSAHGQEAQVEMLDHALDNTLMPPHVEQLIQRCMDGTEPLDGPVPAGAGLKFTPQQVNMCVLRAAGFKVSEVIRITGAGPSAYAVLRHPYAKKIINAIVPENSSRVIDIRTRLDQYAGELLDVMYAKALDHEDLDTVKEVTFGLLDRAGYNVKKEAAAAEKPSGAIGDASVLKRLVHALDGSKMVSEQIMPGWTPKRPPDDAMLDAGDEALSTQPPIAQPEIIAPARVAVSA